MEAAKQNILPTSHPIYKQVISIAQRIVNSNQDHEFFRKQAWTVVIVESEEQNAFVLPVSVCLYI